MNKENKPVNRVTPILTELLANQLSGSKWRKYTLESLRDFILSELQGKGVNAWERHYTVFQKKLEKQDSLESVLTLLTNEVLGELPV
jgi:hypothetical protein